jgi:hypothetical protein
MRVNGKYCLKVQNPLKKVQKVLKKVHNPPKKVHNQQKIVHNPIKKVQNLNYLIFIIKKPRFQLESGSFSSYIG